ncbi:MAG: hypothetical protein GC155_18265 [Alphaproteobacteria bacterium]|nr:hypothetical protein [Alphaproteobacteria bacterium]
MSDRLFFPAAFLVAVAFVLLALQPWAVRPPHGPVSGGGRNAEDVTLSGEELHRFIAGNAGALDIVALQPKQAPILRVTRLADQVYDNPQSGPNLVFAEDVEYALENREIEVTIEARSTGEFAASEFQADYMARPDQESGWKTFELTREFAPYSFTYKTPPRGKTLGYDYLGVRPVAPDKRRTMEIRSIRVHATGPKDAAG